MADQITNTLYLSIGTVNFATPAFDISNIEILLDGPDVRGSDRLLPTAAGVKPYRRRATVSRRFLHLQIYGNAKRDGSATSSGIQGLIDNIALIRQISDPTSGNGTYIGTLHYPGTNIGTAALHVISPLQIKAESDWFARGVLTIELIDGAFTCEEPLGG